MAIPNKPIFLTVKEPCNNTWEDMIPSKDGRFCKSCEKNVVDFTNKGPEFIFRTITEGQGKVCGRFEEHQLNRYYYPPIPESNIFRVRPLLLAFAMGCMVAGTNNSFANETRRNVKSELIVSKNLQISSPGPEKFAKSGAGLVEISGRVKHENDSAGLRGVHVYINDSLYAYTHQQGMYVIKIPEAMLGKKVTIRFSRFNYWTANRYIKLETKIGEVKLFEKPRLLKKRIIFGAGGI